MGAQRGHFIVINLIPKRKNKSSYHLLLDSRIVPTATWQPEKPSRLVKESLHIPNNPKKSQIKDKTTQNDPIIRQRTYSSDGGYEGIRYINYPHLHRQVWAKEYFRAQASGEQTKFTGDYHWDIGHGWSDDMK